MPLPTHSGFLEANVCKHENMDFSHYTIQANPTPPFEVGTACI
jgi:hypothetical protein